MIAGIAQIIIFPDAGISSEYVVFACLWLGAFIRTIFPYLKEWEQNPDLILQKRNFISFFIAGLVSSFAAASATLTYQVPEGSLFEVALASFVAGWGLTDFLTRTMTGAGTPTYKSKKAGST